MDAPAGTATKILARSLTESNRPLLEKVTSIQEGTRQEAELNEQDPTLQQRQQQACEQDKHSLVVLLTAIGTSCKENVIAVEEKKQLQLHLMALLDGKGP